MAVDDTPSLPERMQADLRVAMRARDAVATGALRTTLAAFANAEAPPAPDTEDFSKPPTLGLVEHERLILTADDHHRIVGEQIALRLEAADEYDDIGQADAAAGLRDEAAVLRRYIETTIQ